MAGFPVHTLSTYTGKLARAGFRVAVCEQGTGWTSTERVKHEQPQLFAQEV